MMYINKKIKKFGLRERRKGEKITRREGRQRN